MSQLPLAEGYSQRGLRAEGCQLAALPAPGKMSPNPEGGSERYSTAFTVVHPLEHLDEVLKLEI